MRPALCVCKSGSLIATLVLVLATGVPAWATTTLALIPESPDLICGETGAIDVYIDGGTSDLHGYSLVLGFDEMKLDPVSVETGQLLVDAPCGSFISWNNELGYFDTVFVDGASLGCSVDGPGPIARIWFTATASGSATIEVQSALLRDSANQPLTFISIPAEIIIGCPVAARDRSWSVMKLNFR